MWSLALRVLTILSVIVVALAAMSHPPFKPHPTAIMPAVNIP
jgi:hypothetical protein